MVVALPVEKSHEYVPSVLPDDQARALFEREAWRFAGVSAAVFLARWDAGEYHNIGDTPEGRKIAYLALLIPFGRRNS